MDDTSTTQVGMLVLQIATLLVQAALTAFTAWLGYRASEAKADREAKARALHQHLDRQTGKLTETIEGGKTFKP